MKKRKNKIYGNCRVFSPEGKLMFLCLEKRANWYLERNLAKVISSKPLSIKLKFQPAGEGFDENDNYYLSEKSNICVVCGENDLEILTKHHIVPIEYRKHFPEEIKNRSSHDIVVICNKDHYDYENNYAQKLKKDLEEKYDISKSNIVKNKTKTVKTYNLVLLLLDSKKAVQIPKQRTIQMMKEIKDVFGHDDLFEIAKEKIYKKIDNEKNNIGKEIVDKIEDIESFIKMWRQHFIDSTNPKYMPKGWLVDNPIKVIKTY